MVLPLLSFIPYPFVLILFKHETRARLFAFFPLSALITHPALTAGVPADFNSANPALLLRKRINLST